MTATQINLSERSENVEIIKKKKKKKRKKGFHLESDFHFFLFLLYS